MGTLACTRTLVITGRSGVVGASRRTAAWRLRLCVLALLLWLPALGPPPSALAQVAGAGDGERDPERDPGQSAKPCVSHRVKAPYRGYGYDHEVTLRNRCAKAERCTVLSPSADGPTQVRVPGGGERTLVLRRGSPARTFEVSVECKPAS